MKIPALVRCSLVGLMLPLVANAETWRTLAGESFEGRLSGVYGPLAIFAEKGGTRQVSVEFLDDAALERVADFLAAQPTTRPAWKASTALVTSALRGKLEIVHEKKVYAFDPGDVAEPEIFLVFYGAGSNEASRRFMPRLIALYRELKRAIGDHFELIYVGRDGMIENHLVMVRDYEMPWPFIRFSALRSVKPVERWGELGIPSLVAINPAGDVVLDSLRRGGGYLNPEEVMKEFELLIGMMVGQSKVAKRARHRLAIVQHVRAHPTGEHAPQPYALALDLKRYQTVAVKRIMATVSLDERGHVADLSLEPRQDAVILEQFTRDAQSWLFLPSVRDGKPQPFVVRLPIDF